MPKSTRDYGFARDCAVCGARIPGTPGQEIAYGTEWYPCCLFCSRADWKLSQAMIARRIASGAYKVPKKSDD